MSLPAILVTDGEQRAALAVTRSLGAAGYPVHVCSMPRRSLAGASRFAQSQASVPSALEDPDGFAAAVERLVARHGVRVIVPVTDATVSALLARPGRLGGAIVPMPDLATYRQLADKAYLTTLAPRFGIAVPGQRVVRSPDAAATLDVDALEYPVVVKPGRTIAEEAGRASQLGVGHAADPAQLREALRRLPRAAFPVLVQRRIVGPGIGVFLLRWEGRTLASFVHRRLREKPPSGGVSVYRESIAAAPALLEQSQALLDAFKWQGVAMVEYKVDARTDVPHLMEINGRFWGSLQLAADAGVDFPVLLVQAALGSPAPHQGGYRVGVRSRWWWGDVDQLLARLRRSPGALSLPPDAPGLWRSVADFLVLWRPGDRNEILRWSDPGPFVRETIDWLARR